jgi:hypothetical protein
VYVRSFALKSLFSAVERVFLILLLLPCFANCDNVGICFAIIAQIVPK